MRHGLSRQSNSGPLETLSAVYVPLEVASWTVCHDPASKTYAVVVMCWRTLATIYAAGSGIGRRRAQLCNLDNLVSLYPGLPTSVRRARATMHLQAASELLGPSIQGINISCIAICMSPHLTEMLFQSYSYVKHDICTILETPP